jgi:type I restriction enzyme S subunit
MSEELPEGWAAIELGAFIASMANGVYKPEEFYTDNGTPCLRMYNIQDGQIVLKNVKRMRLTAAEVEQYRLLPGDILINRVNSRELVGANRQVIAYFFPTVHRLVSLAQDRQLLV